MSVELFFDAYKHGEPCGFALANAETAFKQAIFVHSEISEAGYNWRLEHQVTASSPTRPAMVNVNAWLDAAGVISGPVFRSVSK